MIDERNQNGESKQDAANNDPACKASADRKSDLAQKKSHNPEQFEAAERARRDAESERVDTDLYNTSGTNARPPKTAETDPNSDD